MQPAAFTATICRRRMPSEAALGCVSATLSEIDSTILKVPAVKR